MKDGTLLDRIASHGLDLKPDEVHECLALADRVFQGHKFSPHQRRWAENLLARLAPSSSPAEGTGTKEKEVGDA